MNHYPHHIGDFDRATRHLTRIERSIYRDLMDLYYETEKSLMADITKLARRIVCTGKKDIAALVIVLEEFFTLDDSGWRNTRCEAEIAAYHTRAVNAAAAGKASAAKRSAPSSGSEEPALNAGSTTVQRQPNDGLTDAQRKSNQPEPEPEPIDIEAKASLSSSPPPDCPHEKLIDLFGQTLPNLAQPRKSLWRQGKNAPALKARWRWVLTAKHESGNREGQPIAIGEEGAFKWFERFFEYVAKSDFLTGKSTNWACDLGWLVNQSNFEKVLSGVYENKEVAA